MFKPTPPRFFSVLLLLALFGAATDTGPKPLEICAGVLILGLILLLAAGSK